VCAGCFCGCAYSHAVRDLCVCVQGVFAGTCIAMRCVIYVCVQGVFAGACLVMWCVLCVCAGCFCRCVYSHVVCVLCVCVCFVCVCVCMRWLCDTNIHMYVSVKMLVKWNALLSR